MNTSLRTPVILAIDDDPNNMDILCEYLGECDYTVLAAEDGESGISRAAYAKPDLILLDVMMPGIDGFETCRRLKKSTATEDIPVIFMTALAETDHKVNGFEAGGVDYITKPFQREEVLARVRTHLQIGELNRGLREANEFLEKRVAERTAELAHTLDALQGEILERERGEAERLRLAQAIEQAAESVFMADAGWNFTYVNPAFERMSGYAREEVLGRSCILLRSADGRVADYDKIRTAIRRDHSWSGRLLTRRKNGSTFEAETTASSVRDAKGNIVNYVILQRDVTRELELEQELRQAQKMEAIGTLAGGIAHDFNNILTAIIGYVEMAQIKLPKENPVGRELSRALEAGWRAKDLVKRILTFCRQSEQKLQPVRLGAIIEEVIELLRSTMPTQINIRTQIGTSGQEDTVMADPIQIHQVLMNLGSNALHAMRSSGGTFSVSLSHVNADTIRMFHPGLEPGDYLRLTVQDTGHGMDRETRERIFDPYYTTKRSGEGTGMGLAVVQGIVKSIGGMIGVESEPGKGTTFQILLPAAADKNSVEPPVVEPAGRGTERILFVEDEEMLVDLAREQLSSLGYQVTTALDGIAALELFTAEPGAFDLVVTDMNMPGLTGSELALKLLALRPNLPIVLCTGFSEMIDEKQAREYGIGGYMLKPYTKSSLNSMIRSVVGQKCSPSAMARNGAVSVR